MRNKTVILASIVGNGLAWIDFTLYVYFASVFSDIFFPTKSHYISLVLTFSVFAIGFIVRPFGGFVIGYLGDQYGRKNALIFTTILISISTCLIAFIPTYQSIGIFAPVLLIVLRSAQGFAIGGELNSAASLLIEHAKKNARGFAGSLVMCSTFVGMTLASAIATIVTVFFSYKQLIDWGWRSTFLLTGLMGFLILMIRLRTSESPQFNGKIEPKKIKKLFKQNLHFVVLAILILSVMATGIYLLIGYFTVFLVETQGMPLKESMLINFASLILFILLIPVFGFLSDKMGRKIIFLIGAISFVLFSYPIFFLMAQKSYPMVLIGELLFVIILSPITGVMTTMLAEFFPTKIRNLASAVGYNISFAIFGGTAPLIAITLVKITQNVMAPAWYLIGCALLSLGAILFSKENYKSDLL